MAVPEKTRIVHNGRTRAFIYAGSAVVLIAGVVATLISTGLLTHEQVDGWLQSVVTVVTGIVGTSALILATLNRSTSDTEDHAEHTEGHTH